MLNNVGLKNNSEINDVIVGAPSTLGAQDPFSSVALWSSAESGETFAVRPTTAAQENDVALIGNRLPSSAAVEANGQLLVALGGALEDEFAGAAGIYGVSTALGGGNGTLLLARENVVSLVRCGDSLYFATMSASADDLGALAGTIERASLDASSAQVIRDNVFAPVALGCVGDKFLFWTEHNDTFWRIMADEVDDGSVSSLPPLASDLPTTTRAPTAAPTPLATPAPSPSPTPAPPTPVPTPIPTPAPCSLCESVLLCGQCVDPSAFTGCGFTCSWCSASSTCVQSGSAGATSCSTSIVNAIATCPTPSPTPVLTSTATATASTTSKTTASTDGISSSTPSIQTTTVSNQPTLSTTVAEEPEPAPQSDTASESEIDSAPTQETEEMTIMSASPDGEESSDLPRTPDVATASKLCQISFAFVLVFAVWI